uniref:ABC transporter substrate-binding protein n=1 Tax=Desulfobacca acetoxidans TaxID=60893 RepID=A0A7C3Z197_9BACT
MKAIKLVMAVTGAVLCFAAPTFSDSGPIKIGSVLRLSIGAEHGIPSKRGVLMAVDQFNKAGGYNGRKVEVIFEDEKDSPTAAVNAVKKLIEVDKVIALVGPMTSGATLATYKIADEAKVPMVTPTATTPKASGASPYLFRACSRIDTQAKALTEYIAKTYKPKTVAIFYSNEPYGKGCAQVFGADFEKLGIKKVAEESFNRGDRDFKAQLTKIKEANPAIIFIPGYTPETAPAASQARQLGLKQRIIGVYGDMDPEYAKLAGPAAEGHLIAGEYDENYNTPRNKKFREGYYQEAKANNETVNIMFAALLYDATGMVLQGIKQNGPTSEGITKYLDGMKDFDGVTGKLSFNKEHDVVRSGTEAGVYLFEIKNGKYVKVQ